MNIITEIFFMSAEFLLVVWMLKKRQNSILVAHVIGYVLFVVLIGALYRINHDIYYQPIYYFYAHALIFLYLVVVLLLSGRRNFQLIPQDVISLVGERTISNTIFVWAGVNLALFFMYGFGFDEANVERSYLATSLASMTNAAGNGAALLIMAGIGQRHRWRFKLRVAFSMGLYITLVLLFNISGFGARRTILALVIFLMIHLIYSDSRPRAAQFFTFRNVFLGLLAAVMLLGASEYYQRVRQNIYTPAIVAELNSDNTSDFISGLVTLFTPNEANSFNEQQISRPGPLDVLYGIARAHEEYNLTTEGRLFGLGLETVIPRALYPGKPVFNEDIIVVETYGQVSSKFMFQFNGDGTLRYDISTSPMVYYFSDFGVMGVIISAFLFFVTLRIIGFIAQKYRNHRVFQIFIIGFSFSLITSFESASNISVLILRDMILAWGVFVGANFFRGRRRRDILDRI